ncbi:MAG: hypothetical protein HY608_01525 [Planctomycetes bacterium]|nr:hypothetical protein [Planctomycetota bacterium]
MAGDPLYLSIDQGGHATRAVVFDGGGRAVARAEVPVGETRPTSDRVEQDPREMAASVGRVLVEASAALGRCAADVRAAGLATQRSSVVCWDAVTGESLSPILSWQDRRAAAWLASFAPHARAVREATGLVLSPHYGASKMRWCLDHLDPVKQARREGRLRIGPLSSFLVASVATGRPTLADPANASRTLLWNLRAVDWDADLCWRFGVPREVLPHCVPTRHAYGGIPWGAGTLPLTVVTGDQSAAVFAWGVPRADAAYVNLGTGAFLQRIVPEPSMSEDGLLRGVVAIDAGRATYTLEGTVNGAGSALRWAAESLGIPQIEKRLPAWMEKDRDVPLFLNGVSGLGAPFWVADFPSRFVGDGAAAAKAVAVAESVVFLLAENLEGMRTLPDPLHHLVVTGGLSALDGICQRLADVTHLEVRRPPEREATARGLAFLTAGRPPVGRALCPPGDEPRATHWAEWQSPEPEVFRPRPGAPVAGRYAEWRRKMQVALGR